MAPVTLRVLVVLCHPQVLVNLVLHLLPMVPLDLVVQSLLVALLVP